MFCRTSLLLALVACPQATPTLPATVPPTQVATLPTDPPALQPAEGSWNLTLPPTPTGGSFTSESPPVLLSLNAQADGTASAVVSYRQFGDWHSELDPNIRIKTDGSRIIVSPIAVDEFAVASFELPLPGLTADLEVSMRVYWPEGYETADFVATAVGAPDLAASVAFEQRGGFLTDDPVFPWAGDFYVYAFEPIPGMGAATLTADGVPLGTVTELEGLPGAPHRGGVTVDWIPWGTTLTIDVAGLSDLAGNSVSAPAPLTMPVPPTWDGVEDFESGAPSWLGTTLVHTGLANTPEGQSVGYVARGTFGVGVFTVPNIGGTLRFAASTMGGTFAECTVTLETELISAALYTSPPPPGAPCDGCPAPFDVLTDFEEVAFDLTGLEGVEVAVEARCPPAFGPVGNFGMLLDDFRIDGSTL